MSDHMIPEKFLTRLVKMIADAVTGRDYSSANEVPQCDIWMSQPSRRLAELPRAARHDGGAALMKGVCSLCLALVVLGPTQALAQATPNSGGGVMLPGSSTSGQTCVQVQIAGQKPSPYNCLNQQMQQQAQGANSTQPNLPLSANSPSNQVGTFNEQGVHEQYGQNFGKSVIPYRPAPVFNSPLRP